MSVDLCTLADVRLEMETATADTALDTLISSLITIASQAILNEAQRQFTPKDDGPTTHKFRVTGRHVDLAPYDLRVATTVTYDPDGNQTVLSPHTHYELLPIGGDPDGVYTGLQLSKWLSLASVQQQNFGFATVSLAGSWGYAAVPTPVKQACIIAVRSWLRRDLATYAQLDPEQRQLQPQPAGVYKLPTGSLRHLDSYRRILGGGV